MNTFRKFDQLQVAELDTTRSRFFAPEHILTDGQFTYGKLSYAGAFNQGRIIETADGKWLLKREGNLFSRETMIRDFERNEAIGKIIWGFEVKLEMNCGLNATFVKNKGLFAKGNCWNSATEGELLQIDGTLKYARPFKVRFYQNPAKTNLPLLIMALAGINIILLRQAAASV